VQLKLGTRHRKDSLHTTGRDRAESTGCSAQSAVEVIQKVQSCSDSGRVTGECWGPVGPWLWKKVKIKEERRSTNCAEGTLTENGSKWSKKQKRRSEVREKLVVGREDRGRQINKEDGSWTTQQAEKDQRDALEHLVERRKDRLVKP
jgi:hypothetical protein